MAQEVSAPMHPQPTRLIPLRTRSGEVHSHAIVDAEDFERFGDYLWHLNGRDYVRREIKGGKYVRYHVGYEFLHRAVLGLPLGDERRIDHINRNTLDNRKPNLRFATDAQNAQNQGSRAGTSRYRGVCWMKERGKWKAAVGLNRRVYNLGYFDDEDEAARVAAEFRATHMPFSEDAA